MAPSGRSFFGSKAQPSIRNKISSPVALLSTTNQLAYNAPDLFPSAATTAATAGPVFVKPISNPTLTTTSAPTIPSLSFIKSPGLSISTTLASPTSEAEVPDLLHSNSSTPDSSTRGSTPTSAEPNHLSGYFIAAALDQEKRKSNETETPSRSQSRAGKVGELLGRKRGESKSGGRSPGASFSGAARKPSLSGFREKKEESFAPAPFAQRPEVKRPAAPEGGMFAPAEFNSSGPKSNGLSAPKPATSGGLGRKNTVRARGSIDMFAPGMGIGLDKVAEKLSMSNISEEANKVEQKSRTPIADQELKERQERQAARVAELKAAERMAPPSRQNTFDRAANAPLPARTNTFDKSSPTDRSPASRQNTLDRLQESRGPVSKPSMPELRSQARPQHDDLRHNPVSKPSLPDLRTGLRSMNRGPPSAGFRPATAENQPRAPMQLRPSTSDRRPNTAENSSSSQAHQVPSPRGVPSPRSPVKQRTVSPFDNVLAQVDEQLAEQLGPRLGQKVSDVRLATPRSPAAGRAPISPLSPRAPAAPSSDTPAEGDLKIAERGETRPDFVFTAQEYTDEIQCFFEAWVEEMTAATKVAEVKKTGLDKVVVELMGGQAGGAWI